MVRGSLRAFEGLCVTFGVLEVGFVIGCFRWGEDS